MSAYVWTTGEIGCSECANGKCYKWGGCEGSRMADKRRRAESNRMFLLAQFNLERALPESLAEAALRKEFQKEHPWYGYE